MQRVKRLQAPCTFLDARLLLPIKQPPIPMLLRTVIGQSGRRGRLFELALALGVALAGPGNRYIAVTAEQAQEVQLPVDKPLQVHVEYILLQPMQTFAARLGNRHAV